MERSVRRSSNRAGLTIIELLLVMSIIAVIVALAIPGYHIAKRSANEGAAISALRALTTANEQYRNRFRVYAPSLAALRDGDYIDSVLGNASVSPGKSGYLFELEGSDATWHCSARPVLVGFTGQRHFFIDQTGIIRFAEDRPATVADAPVD